jgi:hypothetical protein
MGGGGSQTTEQTFNMSALNKSIFNQITNNTQSLSASQNNVQKMEVDIGEMGPECKVNLGQKIDATLQTSTVMSPQTIAETKDIVQNDLEASAQAALEKTTEAGNLQFGDKQNMRQNINQEITNIVEKTFETNNLNETISSMVNVQDGKLTIKKCNGKLDFTQNVVAELIAEAITESLTSAISENDTLNKLSGDASGELKTKNKGIADIVSKIFAGLTGWMLYVAIACVCCVCVIVLGATMFMLSPGGQKVANAGAGRIGRGF